VQDTLNGPTRKLKPKPYTQWNAELQSTQTAFCCAGEGLRMAGARQVGAREEHATSVAARLDAREEALGVLEAELHARGADSGALEERRATLRAEEEALAEREGAAARREATLVAKRAALAEEVRLNNARYAEAERRLQHKLDKLERAATRGGRAPAAAPAQDA